MTEHKLSDQARIVVHEDGSMEIFKILPDWPHNPPVNILLSSAESRELTRLMQFDAEETWTDEQKERLITATPMYAPDSVDADMSAQCPACKREIKKAQLLKAPFEHIFCQMCKHEDCDCMMTREECICAE